MDDQKTIQDISKIKEDEHESGYQGSPGKTPVLTMPQLKRLLSMVKDGVVIEVEL